MPLCVLDGWFEHPEDPEAGAEIALLKRLGFAGLVLRAEAPDRRDRLRELRKQSLDMPALLVSSTPGASLGDAIDLLRGWKSGVWMSLDIPGRPPSDAGGDAAGAEHVASLADRCRDAGLAGIALVPRKGTWLARGADAARLAERLDRPDVGVVFDLHAWMTEEPRPEPRRALEALRPRLRGVVIHGSGKEPSILPLGEGEFDVGPVLDALVAVDYSGPVALAAAGVTSRIPQRLEASRRAWEALLQRARTSGAPVRAHVFISGVVQGVSFRASTQEQALRAGVVGWVRNLDDGRVEAVFEGPKEPVTEILRWCRHGPAAARVDQVTVSWETAQREAKTFEIRR